MKRTVKFDLSPKKINGVLVECRPIRMRVSYGGSRVDLRLGYSVGPDEWDNDEGRVINGITNKYGQSASEINRTIFDFTERVGEVFARFELLSKRVPTPEEFKELFNELSGRNKEKEKPEEPGAVFYGAYAEFIATMGRQNDWTKPTFTKFNTLGKHLRTFSKKLSFDTLTEEILQGFVTSLHNAELRNTTIAKYIDFLRWFLRWAYNKDYYTGKLHDTFKPKLKGTDGNAKEVIYLEWEELLDLYNFDFPSTKPSLPAVRDVFCFCCFTGLRYSDVAKLRRSDVKENHISIVTQKTNDGLIIELNKYSRAILDKYADIPFPNNKALPIISNQNMNYALKTMGEVAGIDAPQRIVYFKRNRRIEEVLPKFALLTTHCGRRTFVVNALRLGVPANVIMSWTGHSDYKAMKPYIKIVDKLKVAEMGKFDTYDTED